MASTTAANALPPDIDLGRLGARPTLAVAGKQSEALGFIEDPDKFFADAKAEIMRDVGDLSTFRIPLNRILAAIYVRPKTRPMPNGTVLHLPDTFVDEDKWQGRSALVIKMGPHCYEPNPDVQYIEGDKCQVGDWIMTRAGEGSRIRIWGRECVMLESERGVKMVLPRPDVIF